MRCSIAAHHLFAFLYDKNRLNVAISRAKCLAIVVASRKLLHVKCGKPEEMELVNTLCWLNEYAGRRDSGVAP